MVILITAGGTNEPIDAVRSITNTSTGLLACEIHDAWVAYAKKNALDLTIHYVMTATAVLPENSPYTHIHSVTDTFSVEITLQALLTQHRIDIMIHPMAVSDYYVHHTRTTKALSEALYTYFHKNKAHLSPQSIETFLSESSELSYSKDEKIPSSSSLYLHLKRTTKLIQQIKRLSPETKLIGFKLLANATESSMLLAANEQVRSSGCDLVLVNDIAYISSEKHPALLIEDGQIVAHCTTKKEIATAILQEVLK